MRLFKELRTITWGVLATALLATSHASAAPTYQITDLGSLAPMGSSDAWAINNQGQVAGYSWGEGFNGAQATLWTNGQAIQLGPTQSQWSYAQGMNDEGTVVGVSGGSSNQSAVQWVGTSQSILPWQTCCSGTAASANDVNNQGIVVGWTDNGATVWKNGVAQVLLSPSAGRPASNASGINNLNQIVGNGVVAENGSIADRALLWQDHTVTDLGTAAGFSNSIATAINDNGDVVGASFQSGALWLGHATVWRNGVGADLGSLTADQGSIARGINIHGQVVGESHTSMDYTNDTTEALFWDLNSSHPIPLEKLIDEADPLKSATHLTRAQAINDSGVIVATAIIDGKTRGVMLTPISTVPENSTLPLYLLGLGFVSGALCRSRQMTHRQEREAPPTQKNQLDAHSVRRQSCRSLAYIATAGPELAIAA